MKPDNEPRPKVSRDLLRSRRKREVRKTTLNLKREPKSVHHLAVLQSLPSDHERPHTRGECDSVPRPCPFVGCRYHLYLDVTNGGQSITLNFPDLEPEQLVDSCALDVAEHGGETLEYVGELLNVTRERVRQLEKRGRERLAKLHKRTLVPLHEALEERLATTEGTDES